MIVTKKNLSLLLLLQPLLISTVTSMVPLNYCRNLEPFKKALNIDVPANFITEKFDGKAKTKRASQQPATAFSGVDEAFDFVIVGSGPAGSVIANRLTENPHWNVLLLEVGEVPSNLTDIVAMANSFQMTDYNWGYVMEPQENVGLGLNDGLMYWPRGKVLGGSSTIDACVHIRGNRADYDRWALSGNPGWSFADVLPLFKKTEDFLVRFQDPGYHSQGGLLGVQDVPFRSNSSVAFVKAMLELGFDYVDYNGHQQIGVSFAHGTLTRGRRSGAFNSFLHPFTYRTNLKILTGARATEVLINRRTKRTFGVKYEKGGVYHVARARKEVILSAGSFGSPQLLMLSGIGPREHLEELGIPVIKDLPVGENLADNVVLYGITNTLNESVTIPYYQIGESDQPMEDFLEGKGILTTLTGTEALGFVKTDYTTDPDPTVPDVEIIFVGTGNNVDNGTVFLELSNVKQEIYDAIWGPLQNVTAATILPMLYHQKSRGYLRLRSTNPYDDPKFYGNYFTDPNNDDIKVLISAVRFIQNLLTKPAWQRYDSQFVLTMIPGCQNTVLDSDEYWECFLRHLAVSANHQVGTCKMGPASDPEAVVGPDLRVRGITGLRVADTSIFPTPVAAHTSIPTFMVGEKAADLIKEYWS